MCRFSAHHLSFDLEALLLCAFVLIVEFIFPDARAPLPLHLNLIRPFCLCICLVFVLALLIALLIYFGNIVQSDTSLESGHIAAAGLDVFLDEPTPDPRLLDHPRISVTPHIGAATEEAQERIGIELAEKVLQCLG
jgi:hypothetical protein